MDYENSSVSGLEAAFTIGLMVLTVWSVFAWNLVNAGFLFVLTVVNVLLFEYSVNSESYPISEKTINIGSMAVVFLVFVGSFWV